MELQQTPEQIQQHYKAMLDSVELINAIIAGGTMTTESTETKKATVSRNVAHLELMLTKTFWSVENMAPIQVAIQAGKTYSI